MGPHVTLSELHDDPAAQAALDGLTAFNASFVGPHGYKPLSLIVRRDAAGEPVGGAFGWCYGAWFFLHYFFLPEDLRLNLRRCETTAGPMLLRPRRCGEWHLQYESTTASRTATMRHPAAVTTHRSVAAERIPCGPCRD